MQAPDSTIDEQRPSRLKRVGLTVAATLVSINIWTGAPLLAVWVGSRVAPASGTSMGAIALVMVVLVAAVSGLAVALTRINAAYDHLTGHDRDARRVAPWLRSMRDERHALARAKAHAQTTAVERAVILSVVLAVIALEVWFFFFARYSIPGA
ncbi:MAG: hypothetical protein KGJ43_07170 [Acidobacteriota bacterium]|nr:hypothetical protein [Acidobacteriota bacterium]